MLLFECTIPMRPIVKKNTQRVVGQGRSKHVIYSPRYREWLKVAERAVCGARNGISITEPIIAHYSFYFANRQSLPDVSNICEGVSDVLESCGVIKNDRLIQKLVAERFVGSEPKTTIKLFSEEEK